MLKLNLRVYLAVVVVTLIPVAVRVLEIFYVFFLVESFHERFYILSICSLSKLPSFGFSGSPTPGGIFGSVVQNNPPGFTFQYFLEDCTSIIAVCVLYSDNPF